MKITQSTGISNVMRAYGKNVRRVAGTENVAKDKVEISSTARELQAAKKAFDALPEIREDRVAEIKSLMASGKYKPSAEEVIEKLMSHVGIL
ncbi:MAG: flagellar biosynthesis anti-sigma factor FlgM [Bacillota bacterium]|nr:flagellar biosynthesis anti-sigma factor FlgM [Bacillota bacterium]